MVIWIGVLALIMAVVLLLDTGLSALEKRERMQRMRKDNQEMVARIRTQTAQVAKETGVSEPMYQRYEYGKSEPGVRKALQIARVLDRTVEELFGAETRAIDETPGGNRANQ